MNSKNKLIIFTGSQLSNVTKDSAFIYFRLNENLVPDGISLIPFDDKFVKFSSLEFSS